MGNTSVTKDGNIVVVKSNDEVANTVSIQSTSTPSVTVTYPDVGAPSNITKDGNTVVVKSIDGTATTVIVQQPDNSIVSVNTPGPQGPPGAQGSAGNFDAAALVTTGSFNTFTSSYYLDSSSFASRINNISVDVDLSGYTATSSFNAFTSSYKTDSASFANRINNITFDTSSLVSTELFNTFTSSYNTGSFTGSFKGQLIGTSSWATNAVTALNANTATSATSATSAGSSNVAELANTVKIQEYNSTLDFRPLLIPEISGSADSYTSTLNNAGNLIYNGEKNLLRFNSTLNQSNNPLFPSLEIGAGSTGSLVVYGSIWAKQLNVLPGTIIFVDSINTASAATLTELKFENSKLFLTTGSYSGSFIGNLIGTASWTSNYNESDPIFVAKSGSFTLTSSFNTFTSSYKNDSSSFANRINNITFDTGSLISTSSFNVFTSSYKTDSSSFNNKIDNLTNSTSSYVLNSQTSSFATLTSNTFNGNQIISGALVVTGNVTVFGSSSLLNLTASQLNVGTNVISVNIFEPAQRFGGLLVYDSGSFSHQATASLLWDSEKNHWIYQNASGSLYNGGMLLSGPRNFGALGDEPTLTSNYIVKSQGGDHITTSSLYDSDGLVRINSNTQITGSLEVSLGITSSLFGTSSWAINYNETDPIFVSVSASFVTTQSFNDFTSSYKIDSSSFNDRINNITFDTGSLLLTSSFNNFTSSYNTGSFTGSFIGNLIGTSSWSTNALTASYLIGGSTSTLIDTLGARIYTDDTFITAGSKGYKHIAYDADIIKTRTIANTNGNIDINIKRNNVTLGTISLLNQSSSLDTTLTGWTTTLNENDLLEFYVSQSSTYITDISIFIDIQSR